jgi:hypothetical protein
MSNQPRQPHRVPTLTEVIGDLQSPELVALSPLPRGEAEVAGTAPTAGALAQDSRVAERVIACLHGRIDLLFEHRLREALAPTLSRLQAALADELRKDLARVLREAVQEAVREELASQRGA